MSLQITEQAIALTIAGDTEIILQDTAIALTIAESGIQGPPGEQGQAGGLEINSAEADENILIGQPLYLKANGHVGLAQANDAARSQVCGFATTAVPATFAVDFVSEGSVTRSDWGAIAGTTTLTPGTEYFLSTVAGQISSVAPVTGFVVSIGRAIATNRLDIEIQPSIKL